MPIHVPIVDILLPCYNSGATLLRTLESIQAQSFRSFRVILVDNNSTDNSCVIFQNIDDSRFEFQQHDQNVGLGDNFNRALENVSAEFFCIMHTDDEYEDTYLETMVAAMKSAPNTMLAFCNAQIIDAASKKKVSIKNFIKKMASPSGNAVYAGYEGLVWISKYNKIIAPSVMYRRCAIEAVGKFNTELSFTLDWEYYFRTLNAGGTLMHVNTVLLRYRVHSKQQTAKLIASMTKYYEIKGLLDRINNAVDVGSTNISQNRYKYLKYTILADIFSDLKRAQFSAASKKLRFFFGLFGAKLSEGAQVK